MAAGYDAAEEHRVGAATALLNLWAHEDALLKAFRRAVRRISEEIESLKFNTASAVMMEFTGPLLVLVEELGYCLG